LILKVTPKNLVQFINDNYEDIKKNQNKGWLEKIKIVSEISNVDEKSIMIVNLTYEVFCTTIIIDSGEFDEETKFNEIFMGRNLDYAISGESYRVEEDFINQNLIRELSKSFLSDLAYEAHYYRHDKLVYIAQGMVGHVGILNGVKIGKFGLSLNARRSDSKKEIMDSVVKGYTSPAYLLNEVLNESENFGSALQKLSNTKTSASCYLSLSGIKKNEGVIIVRSINGVVEQEFLDVDKGKWYLVQTNSDRGIIDVRRPAAEKRLDEIKAKGLKINYENLLSEVIAQPPNKNFDTIYSTVQSGFKGGFLNSNYWEMTLKIDKGFLQQ
jgi:hypothetical protein